MPLLISVVQIHMIPKTKLVNIFPKNTLNTKDQVDPTLKARQLVSVQLGKVSISARISQKPF